MPTYADLLDRAARQALTAADAITSAARHVDLDHVASVARRLLADLDAA